MRRAGVQCRHTASLACVAYRLLNVLRESVWVKVQEHCACSSCRARQAIDLQGQQCSQWDLSLLASQAEHIPPPLWTCRLGSFISSQVCMFLSITGLTQSMSSS